MYQEKLRGFVGLRATLVIKVQVNSQPFQQGRLMLQYIPYAQYMPERVRLINLTLQGRSGCPRTDLDLSVGTEIEMRIPYVSPHVYFNLITGQGSFGSIYLVVYSALKDEASGTGSVEYTVWAHLEDVDVQYPTGANIYTGNDDNFVKIAQNLLSGNMTKQEMRRIVKEETYLKPTDKIFAQGMSELTQMKESGVISSGVGKLGEALHDFSKIPYLGNIFTMPAWLASKSSNILKILGFSKPTIQGLPCEMKIRGNVRMANYDGADASHRLALSACNEIETKAGLAGTDVDEMAIPHIVTIPNYWSRFTWATTDATAKNLWTDEVTPYKIKSFSKTITNRYRATHLGYFANCFSYWRGDLVYTFKFVKTTFHSGRVRISFIPYYYDSTISSGTPDVSRTQKVIVDLRTSNEVSFTVPYVATRPWMFCADFNSPGLGTNNKLKYNCSTGVVQVDVLNQLVAANNVFPSVDVIVEISGAPNLTFAGFNQPNFVPYSGALTTTTDERSDHQRKEEYQIGFEDKIIAQVMGESESIQRNDAQMGVTPEYTFGKQHEADWSPEAYCIGEKVISVRQLIKRFGTAQPAVDLSDTNPVLLVSPHSVITPTATPDLQRNISPLEYFYFLYAFWRGSVRYKFQPITVAADNTSALTKIPFQCSYFTTVQRALLDLINKFKVGENAAIKLPSVPDGVVGMGNSLTYLYPNLEGSLEVEVPYYNVSHISPAKVYLKTEAPITVANIYKGNIPPSVFLLAPSASVGTGTKVSLDITKAAGDDYSFMYLLGVPPLTNVKRPATT
nr:MAG: capsid protein [brine shrimp dicistrovirus 1]